MRIVYHHNIGQTGYTPPRALRKNSERSFTIVMDNIPNHDQAIHTLIPAMRNGAALETAVEMQIGVAIVHPNEQFVRRTGVRLATAALQTELVKIIGVVFIPDGRMVIHYELNNIQFSIIIHGTGRAQLADGAADAVVAAVRGDWLEASRAASRATIPVETEPTDETWAATHVPPALKE